MTCQPAQDATTIASGMLRKPAWIRVKIAAQDSRFGEVKNLLRSHQLATVCEEARCPNIGECFGAGTASFMILGSICTRGCPFCNVSHGRPAPPDALEPVHLAQTIAQLHLAHVVITSVNRDDLPDGGAGHFVDCITHIRQTSPDTVIEVLVPDFKRCGDLALAAFRSAAPDIWNHNLETVPRLYKTVRPGANYGLSLGLLQQFGRQFASIPTKSGLMMGLGETDDEILAVMHDLRSHGVSMLTIGQYLAPSASHLPVVRYVHPDTFDRLRTAAYAMGFAHAAVGALVRSSYQADRQARHVPGARHHVDRP